MPSQIFVISFENPAANLATGECFADLLGFEVRPAGRPRLADRGAGRVDDGRDFVVDGEAMF
jgi:hypothetical protein